MATFPMNTPGNTGEVIDEVWAKEILANRRKKMVMEQLVNHDYEGQIKNHGDTVHIISLPDLEAQDIVPGTEMTVTPVDPTEQLLVIDQYKGIPVELQDMLVKQSTYDLRRPFTEKIGHGLANAIDKYLLTKAVADASTSDANGTSHVMAPVAAIDKATLVAAHQILDMAEVPDTGRALVINGVGKADLRNDPNFSSYNETGEAGLVRGNGYVGEIYDTPVYVTNQIAKTDANANWAFVLLQRDALSVAVQIEPETESQRRALTKSTLMVGSTLFGGKMVRPDHVVVIKRTV